jgi:hypothetical protein
MRIRLLAAAATLCLAAHAEPGGITTVGWSQQGKYLVTVGPARRVRVHDGATGRVLKAVTAPGEASAYIAFSPDYGEDQPNTIDELAVSGNYALTASQDKMLQWWSLPDLAMPAAQEATYGVGGIALAAGGRVAAYNCTSSRYLDSDLCELRWDAGAAHSNSFPDLLPPSSSESFGAPRLSPDGRWAIAYVEDGMHVWKLDENGTTTRAQTPLQWSSWRLGMGDTHFFTVDDDSVSMRPYEAPDTVLRRFPCPAAVQACVDAQESRLVVLGEALWVWDLASVAGPREWPTHPEAMWASPDLKRLALRRDSDLEVWDVDNQRKLYTLPMNAELKEEEPAP